MIKPKRLPLLAFVLALCPFALIAQDRELAITVFGEGPSASQLGEGTSFEVQVAVSMEQYNEMMADWPNVPDDLEVFLVEDSSVGLESVAEGSSGGPESVSSHAVVGSVSCSVRAHDPHKGTSTGTVRAKATGGCRFNPIRWGPWPIGRQLRWTMTETLLHTKRGRFASEEFVRHGWLPRWRTTVDSYAWLNGVWVNVVVVRIRIVGNWRLIGSPLVAVEIKDAFVSSC